MTDGIFYFYNYVLIKYGFIFIFEVFLSTISVFTPPLCKLTGFPPVTVPGTFQGYFRQLLRSAWTYGTSATTTATARSEVLLLQQQPVEIAVATVTISGRQDPIL